MPTQSSDFPPLDPVLLARLRDRVSNPLTTIAAEAQILMLDHDGSARDAAAVILAECHRITSLLRELRPAPATRRPSPLPR